MEGVAATPAGDFDATGVAATAGLRTTGMASTTAATAAAGAVRSFKDVPGPHSYPIIGSLWKYYWRVGPYEKFKYHKALIMMHKKYGPVVKERRGPFKTIVHVFDPEDIKTVYQNEGRWPLVPPLQETTALYRQKKQMSLGLGNTNGEEWYRLRSNSQQKMLRPREVQRHLPAVNQVAKEFVRRLAAVRYLNYEINDLKNEVGKWSLENAAMLVFDRRLGCFENSNEEFARQLVAANKTIFRLSGILKLSFPFYKLVYTPKWHQLMTAEDVFYGAALQMVDDALLSMKELADAGELTPDRFYLLQYLASREALTMKDVAVICISLFSDGLSTTTPTVLFNLYCLARYPSLQETIYEEIMEVTGGEKYITQEHINKMTYMKAFIKETFRLFPNGTEVSRYTEQDLVLSGFVIPKGTHVDLNPSVHFRDPELFPDPDVHRPERWLRSAADSDEDQLEDKIHPYLLTPFGHGTRMCAGRRFAEQDIHVLLATILRRFRLEYPVGEGMEQMYNTLLFPDRPVRVQFMDRSSPMDEVKWNRVPPKL